MVLVILGFKLMLINVVILKYKVIVYIIPLSSGAYIHKNESLIDIMQ